MKKARLLVADDHSLVRIGLVTLLKTDRDLVVVGEAEDGDEAVRKAVELKPDIVVLDLMMPVMDGVEALHEIKSRLPSCKVIVLTTFASSNVIARAIDEGADGALLKSSSNDELLNAIHVAWAGGKAISDEVRELLRNDPPLPELSTRQRQILEAVAEGLTNKEIATRLSLHPESVKSYLDALYEKLGVSTRAEALGIALRKDLLKI